LQSRNGILLQTVISVSIDDPRKNIHLVAGHAPKQATMRLTLGAYFADPVADKATDHYYYFVQRHGSADVLEISVGDVFSRAEAAARKALERWNRGDRRRAS
jgi:hypothetical protein